MEIIFSSYFHFKAFSKRERERERERESPDRKERGRRDFAREPRAPVWQPQTELQSNDRTAPIVDRSTAALRLQHRAAQSRLRSISPPPRDLTFSFAARSQFDRIWWIFLLHFVSFVNECGIDSWSTCLQLRKCMENWVAWLCKAFSIKMFERTKHWNWFSVKQILRQPNSFNIFFFPENSISEKYLFSGKYFTETKHSLNVGSVDMAYSALGLYILE